MIYYADEDLGLTFIGIVRTAGIHLEIHRDHFPQGTLDKVWIPEIAKRGWVHVTTNYKQKHVPVEKEAIYSSGARMLYMRKGKGVKAAILAQNFVNTFDDIDAFFSKHPRPCIAVLERPQNEEDILLKKPGAVKKRHLAVPEHLRNLKF